MALHHNVRVPVPGKTYKKKQNDSVYIYYYIEFFRKNGKPTNKSVAIGKLDKDSEMLIPNDHYYEYFDSVSESPVRDDIVFEGTFSIGYSAVIEKAFQDLNLDQILHDNFELSYRHIMSVASYAIREGAVMSYIDDFMEKHYCFGSAGILTNQRVSELFASLSENQRKGFFIDWIKHVTANDCIAYDVTSISTYSNGIEEAEFGYNRDHDDLRQINIGMFAATNSRLPVYFENYNGSLTDKTNLESVLKNAKDVGIVSVRLVMDGGFFDDERLKQLSQTGHIFTVGMPSTLKTSKKLLDEHRSKIHDIRNRTRFTSNYAIIIDKTVQGIKGRVLIGLNTRTQDLMMESMKKDIEKREQELRDKKIKKYDTVIKKKRYTELFEIKPDEEGGYTYALKEDAVYEISKNYGYFLVFTIDTEATADEILYYYREKDVDEKMFYQLKDYMECNRLHTHMQQTTDGKLFTLFVALIVRSYVYNKLSSYMSINHLTLEKCFRKLENLKAIKIRGQKARLTKALTKQQNDLLSEFGIDIKKTVERL